MAEQVRVVVDAMGGNRETGHKSNSYRKTGSDR